MHFGRVLKYCPNLTAIRKSEFPTATAQWVADTLEVERSSAHRRLEGVTGGWEG